LFTFQQEKAARFLAKNPFLENITPEGAF